MAKNNDRTGIFLRIPYDFRKPTWQKIKSRVWNPASDKLFSPHAFGWGYSLNFHALIQRLRSLVGR